MNNEYSTRGVHILVDIHGVNFNVLNDIVYLNHIFKLALEKCGATIIGYTGKQFEPHGLSFAYLLEESHCTIHCYPESEFAAIDFYCCGESDPNIAVDYIIEVLQPKEVYRQEIIRGVR